MRIEIDTLDYVIEGVLSMEYKDRKQRSVAFILEYLNKIEKNCDIYDKEILAVIRRLENWRYLLEDTKFKFKV